MPKTSFRVTVEFKSRSGDLLIRAASCAKENREFPVGPFDSIELSTLASLITRAVGEEIKKHREKSDRAKKSYSGGVLSLLRAKTAGDS